MITCSLALKGSLLLLVVGIGASCGSDSGDGDGIGADSFVGTWQYVSGSVVTTCPGAQMVSVSTAGEMTSMQLGTESDLVMPLDGCMLRLDIENDTARSIAPATCTLMLEGLTVTVTIQTYSFTTPDGVTAAEAGTGQTIIETDGQSLSCTAVISGELRRSP